jgi:hypothetical protein
LIFTPTLLLATFIKTSTVKSGIAVAHFETFKNQLVMSITLWLFCSTKNYSGADFAKA